MSKILPAALKAIGRIHTIAGILLMFPILICAQSLKEERIFKLPSEYNRTRMRHLHVDAQGHFCYATVRNGKYYMVRDADTLGPYTEMASLSDPQKGGLDIMYKGRSSDENPEWYYRSRRGAEIFGPVRGKLTDYTTGRGSNDAAVIITSGDKLTFHINGKEIYSIPAAEAKSSYQNWCVFNKHGDKLYFTARKGVNRIFLNKNEVASVKDGEILMPELLDNGDFIYRVKQSEPVAKNKTAGQGQEALVSSMPGAAAGMATYFVHYHRAGKESVIGPFSSLPHGSFISNGGFIFYGSEDTGEPTGLAIGERFLADANVPVSAPKLLAGPQRYLVPFSSNGKNYLSYNGKEYEFNYSEMQFPAVDTIGNIAFYKLKDGKLYRCPYVTAQNEILNEFGKQPVPIAITPAALATYYVNAGGGGHIFQNGALVMSAPGPVEILNTEYILSPNRDPENALMPEHLHIINAGAQSLFLYKGLLSEPSIQAGPNILQKDTLGFGIMSRAEPGAIVAGDQSRSGFFVIQNRGLNRYWLNVNNKVYMIMEGVLDVIADNATFDGRNLEFIVRKEDGIYRYTLVN